MDELGGFFGADGTERNLDRPPLALERTQHRGRGRIVLQFSRTRRTGKQQRGRSVESADDVVKQRSRRLVDPLQIIEGQGGRLLRDHDLEHVDDRIEQLGLVGGTRPSACNLRKQRRKIAQPFRAALVHERPQEIDPDSVGAAHFGLECASADCPSADRMHALLQPGQQPALADAGLPSDQQHLPSFSGRGRRSQTFQERTFGVTSDEWERLVPRSCRDSRLNRRP